MERSKSNRKYDKREGESSLNILVTGGSRGIGAKIVSTFAKYKHNVVINYNNSKDLARKLSDDLNACGCETKIFKANVSDMDEVCDMVRFCKEMYGDIDVLVNNAGVSKSQLFDKITQSEWDEMINVNLKGVFNCSQAVVSDMIRRKNGCIINISSIWGIDGAAMEVHYSAAKAGVIGFTKALAKELGPSNIRVNCVAPGVIETDMLNGYSDDELEVLRNNTSLLRLGVPEDIANVVYFLASNKASFITGEVINVSGGFL